MASKYFEDWELECNCGDCSTAMDENFMRKLDALREFYGKPIHLSSAYRCPEYNAKVSSTGSTGPHTTGKAVDVDVSGQDAHRLVMLAMKLGFTGVGVMQRGEWSKRFIHLDLIEMGHTRPRIWSY